MKKVNFSDKSLIEKIKNRDHEALSSLVEAYTSHLYKAGLGQGLSEEMAHEVTANTWTTFLEIVPKFEGRSHIRTFLFGIFYNKVSELRRSNYKFEKTDPIEEVIESQFEEDGHWCVDFKDPSDISQNKELLSIVQRCLEHLPDLQKSAFYLKHIVLEDTESILEILKITNVNLRQLIFRAKNRIRNCVEKSLS